MHPFDPDILTAAHGLSIGVSGPGVAVGLALWAFGWRWHRFWIVVGVTIAAGLYGLATGNAFGGHAIAVGVLLAISAGLLALELARVFSFLAGGMLAWLAGSAMFPNAQELGIFFLGGGLAGLVFYRIGIMLATSFLGILVAGYSGLILAEAMMPFDSVAWSGNYSIALTVAVCLLTLLGIAVQGAQARWRAEVEAEDARQERRWGRGFFRRGWRLTRDERALRDVFAKQ